MASEESKLLALFRLDFYKRKKNWKLPEDARKIPPKITNNLNKTYNIVEEFPEPEFDVEQVSPHNKAFLEKTEATDDALEPQLPDDEALESQLPDDEAQEPQLPDGEALEPQLPDDEAQEPQLPDNEVLEPQLPDDEAQEPRLPDGEALEPQLPDDEAQEPQLPDDEVLEPQLPDNEVLEPQLSDDEVLEPQLPDDEVLEPQLLDDEVLEPQLPDDKALVPQLPDDEARSLPPLENMYRPASWAEQARWGEKTDSLWEQCRQYWCGAEDKGVREELAYDQNDGARYPDSLWRLDPASQLELNPAVDLLGRHLEYLTPEQMHQIAGEWLTLHNYPAKQEECADTCEEYRIEGGADDFMRGSHYAPHSTEIDLSITQECGCMGNNLYGWSVRKLAQEIRRHHSALTVLLREQALREKQYPHSLLHHPLPFEEYPMRDTGPLRPDVVLSGSHHVSSATGYDADAGRGRGRLQQHRLVGIEMGRPFWKVNKIE